MTPKQEEALRHVREARLQAGTAYERISLPLEIFETLCTIPITADREDPTCPGCNPSGAFVYGDERCNICKGSGNCSIPRQ